MSVKVSFVVIGRNEVATIVTSLQSAVRAADSARLDSYEIIYVDSDSTDGSVPTVRRAMGGAVRIVRLTGARNAAIARNVGASLATGRVLFFVDGDMEVDPAFLRDALDERGAPVHAVVTGRLPEKVYDAQRRLVNEVADRRRIRERGWRSHLGGVFVIERALFESMGGFASELRCNEDLDLGLRLASRGTRVLALTTSIATHHTVDYLDWTRLIPMIRDGSLCYPGAIFRRHLTNRHYLPILLSEQRSTIVLLVSLMLGTTSHPAWFATFFLYVAAKNLRRSNVSFVQDLVGVAARSVCFLAGVVTFFPRPVPPEAITYDVASEPV